MLPVLLDLVCTLTHWYTEYNSFFYKGSYFIRSAILYKDNT